MLVPNIVAGLLFLPFSGIVALLFIPSSRERILQIIGVSVTSLSCIFSWALLLFYQSYRYSFQSGRIFFYYFHVGILINLQVSENAMFFLLVLTLLIALSVVVTWGTLWDIKSYTLKQYLITVLLVEFFLIGYSCVIDGAFSFSYAL